MDKEEKHRLTSEGTGWQDPKLVNRLTRALGKSYLIQMFVKTVWILLRDLHSLKKKLRGDLSGTIFAQPVSARPEVVSFTLVDLSLIERHNSGYKAQIFFSQLVESIHDRPQDTRDTYAAGTHL